MNNLLPAKIESDKLAILNDTVKNVISAKGVELFNKAFIIAKAAGDLKAALNKEYMQPIMQLQNNRLGFRTDSKEGYSEEVVKNCLIEAVLTGVQPFGNQFNIIAGNCYITKEGFGHLLANFPGLSYEIIPKLPRISADKTSAAIVMEIEWTIGGEKKTREIDFPIKVNQYMGTDAVIGKATRKARAWLYYTLTGLEIGEGDAQEVNAEVVSSAPLKKTKEESERERISLMIDEAKALADLNKLHKDVPDALLDKYTVKMDELKAAK